MLDHALLKHWPRAVPLLVHLGFRLTSKVINVNDMYHADSMLRHLLRVRPRTNKSK